MIRGSMVEVMVRVRICRPDVCRPNDLSSKRLATAWHVHSLYYRQFEPVKETRLLRDCIAPLHTCHTSRDIRVRKAWNSWNNLQRHSGTAFGVSVEVGLIGISPRLLVWRN